MVWKVDCTYGGEIDSPRGVYPPISPESTPKIPRRLPETRKRIRRVDPHLEPALRISMLSSLDRRSTDYHSSRGDLKHRTKGQLAQSKRRQRQLTCRTRRK